jgi:radical SAM family uncharacterized protein/radical SAM-linked protein
MSHEQDLREILKQVEKPGRYIGGEWNEIKKNPGAAAIKIALVFPDVYEIGMSYLGQKILYHALNSRPCILAERVFAPWPDLEQKLRSRKIPLLSLENKIPLRNFDILGFSLLYELNYSNILTILDLGGFPFFSEQREEDCPLIIAGGPAAFNPEPVSNIFDAFFLGDGEEGFPEIAERYVFLRNSGAEKDKILSELAKIQGVYVPRLYTSFEPVGSPLLARRRKNGASERIKKRIISPLDKVPFPEKIVVPDIQVVFDRVAVEAGRGCPQRCRFCQATQIYFPFRIMGQSSLLKSICGSLRSTGYEDVSLSALSVSDYPYLEETIGALMESLAERKISLSLSSLRPQGLTSTVAESILRVRKTGFTLVPEAGTDRLRRVINKHLKNQDILDAAAHAFSRGWQLLKLYFMVGLPTETQEDLEGIVHLARGIIQLGKTIMKSPPRINLSLSSFIPKPHTPFQWLAMDAEESLKEKQQFIRSRLRPLRSIKIKDHLTKTSILEGVFSRGDRRLGPVLVRAWRNGARFDSWKDYFNFSFWEEAFAGEHLGYQSYLGSLGTETRLPWDHIDTGIKKAFLLAELEKAIRGEPTPSCLEASCSQCQGCDEKVRPGKKFSQDLQWKAPKVSLFGERAEGMLRYEVMYSKSGWARFLSHLDLANHLQRALRRAGIELAFSQGFHPKMLLSYGPALPLGTEGKAECLEFKSTYRFDEQKFVQRLNRYAGSGIRFFWLRNLTESDPSLSERIRGMIYSVDLRNADVRQALDTRKREKKRAGGGDLEFVQEEMAEFWRQNPEALKSFWVDKKKKQLFLCLPHTSRRGLRSQDILDKVFALPYPTFYLTRERFLFEGEEAGSVTKTGVQELTSSELPVYKGKKK